MKLCDVVRGHGTCLGPMPRRWYVLVVFLMKDEHGQRVFLGFKINREREDWNV